jgi:hypothetical protein
MLRPFVPYLLTVARKIVCKIQTVLSWVVTPYNFVGGQQPFDRTSCLHLHDQSMQGNESIVLHKQV